MFTTLELVYRCRIPGDIEHVIAILARLFGLIGMAAYWHGKRAQQPRTRWWGVALMFYPYVVSATWLLYTVGVALCLGMWWDGQRG